MTKKMIISLGATALLATTLMAFSPQGGMGKGKGCDSSSCNQEKMMNGQGHKKGFGFMRMVKKLDLSDEQRAEIRGIVKKARASMPNPHSAFTDSSFDKKAFIELAKAKRDGKLERRAEIIEKVYAVLNDSQKKDLRTMLDMKAIMQKNMMQNGAGNGKNCNGRR